MMDKRAAHSYWVMQCPVISTGHLTADVAARFAEAMPGGEFFYGLYHAPTTHGGFVACPDETVLDDEVPRCLRDCMRWAMREGFEWLRFDADGDQIGELTVYEW